MVWTFGSIATARCNGTYRKCQGSLYIISGTPGIKARNPLSNRDANAKLSTLFFKYIAPTLEVHVVAIFIFVRPFSCYILVYISPLVHSCLQFLYNSLLFFPPSLQDRTTIGIVRNLKQRDNCLQNFVMTCLRESQALYKLYRLGGYGLAREAAAATIEGDHQTDRGLFVAFGLHSLTGGCI